MSRKSRSIPAAMIAFVLLAVALRAGDDPWKAKPFDQWTDLEVVRVLKDSPWVRTSTVEAAWMKGRMTVSEGINPGLSNSPTVTKTSPTNSGAPPTGFDPGVGGTTPQEQFTLYWVSSRTMRGAIARRSTVTGPKAAEEAAKYVNTPQAEFQIAVEGADMTPFQNSDEKTFQSLAWLQPKNSKEKYAPTKVVFEHDAKGNVGSATFFFAKKNAAGEPVIGSDTKKVEFICKVATASIQVTFETSKMADKQGPDL